MKTKLTIAIAFFACLYLASWLEYWQRPYMGIETKIAPERVTDYNERFK